MSIGNSWQRLSVSGVAPAGATCASITAYVSGSPWAAGDYQDLDAFMLTEGSALYKYADGNTPGWAWFDAPNASRSSGPALP